MNGKLSLMVILLCISQLTNAQSFIEINGKLLNYEDSTAVTGAHIYLEHTNLGTITNTDGVFALSIASKFATYQVRISCIGYKSLLMDLNSLKNTKQSTIYLEPNVIVLEEVFVYSNDMSKEILKVALKKMQDHYIGVPIKMKTFYRELLKQDSNYVRLTDAVMEIYQDNFYGNDINNRRVKLIESRVSDDMFQNNIGYEMSPSRLINRIRPLNFPPNFFEDYDFQMNITSVDTSIVYAISTKPKNDLQKIALEGTIYIRKCDSAIIGYDAKVSKKHLKYFPEQIIYIKYKGRKQKIKVSVIEELLSSRYFEYQGHWYLRNASLNRTHLLSSNDGSIHILLNMNAQLVIYDLQVGDITEPRQRENINYNKIIPPTKPYNQEFWNSFNVLDYTVVEKEVKNSLEKNRTLNEQFIENDKH